MINKDNKPVEKITTPKPTDTVNVNPQCHILIKDKDTGKVLLNKRG